jgi:hypothetical protein
VLQWKTIPPYYPGRSRRLEPYERAAVLTAIEEGNWKRMTIMTKEFAENFYGDERSLWAPSYSTMMEWRATERISTSGMDGRLLVGMPSECNF